MMMSIPSLNMISKGITEPNIKLFLNDEEYQQVMEYVKPIYDEVIKNNKVYGEVCNINDIDNTLSKIFFPKFTNIERLCQLGLLLSVQSISVYTKGLFFKHIGTFISHSIHLPIIGKMSQRTSSTVAYYARYPGSLPRVA